MFQNRQGLAGLLKEGGSHFSGVDEAICKNIEACRTLSTITRTSLGPNSMNKLIINHLEKHYVTSDAATIVNELEVIHPAAKMLVMAAKMQEQEFGDATNFTVVFAGELLSNAENLLKMGLHSADIIKGYETALAKAGAVHEGCVCWSVKDMKDVNELTKGLQTVIASKQGGMESHLAQLVSQAAVNVMPTNQKGFDADNIRVAKICGGSLHDSHVVNGMVVTRDAHGTEKHKKDCKVCVLGCGLEMTSTETKGTVLIHNADELMSFTKSEESKMEEAIKSIRDAGCEVIIANGSISDIAQHFCNKYGILTLKEPSKFGLRRICRTLGATALPRLGAPLPEEIGVAESVSVEEISSNKVTVIKAKDSRVATIVLRGATPNTLDEVERSIEDAVNTVKAITRDPRFTPGAGATEIEIAHQLQGVASGVSGLDQYAVLKFAESLEAVPRVLSENAGQKATETITALYAAHQQGKKSVGVDVEVTTGAGVCDAVERGILDHFETKLWAIRLATDAALTVLRVDQIIMAKPAGIGAKPPAPAGDDD